MATPIEEMIEDVIGREGGFVDHPADRGGPTRFGITQATLGQWLGRPATVAEVRALDRAVAAEIYRQSYYIEPRLDRLPASIQPFVFDSGVNHGPRRAIRFVQQVCNAAGFGPLDVDGLCGPATSRAAARAEAAMGGWFLEALVEERRNFYHLIVEHDPGQWVFLRGWLNRLAAFDHGRRLVA